MTTLQRSLLGIIALAGVSAAAPAPPVAGHPEFASPNANPIAVSHDGRWVYVTNTAADTVDVIDATARTVARRIAVGVDPVGLALRPDGRELWVANHLSDSVSVIDTDPASPTRHEVLATVQAWDDAERVTRFDEPVGVTFASDAKAYVALSSVNEIAIVDVASRRVTGRLDITAQEPRAIVARHGLLYVVPFESGNQTQISGCIFEPIDGEHCTFDALQHVILGNNVRSRFYQSDIVRDVRLPDRDLFVFDTSNDALIATVSSIGTLLYGLAVDSQGRVFIAQTEARNDANGRAGTRGHTLAQLGNRAFLNQIGSVRCGTSGCDAPQLIELEPLPPAPVTKATALATPYAIQVSADDAVVVATAASSSRLFTVDAATGSVLGRVDVGAIPRGLALESDGSGRAVRAWVYNAVHSSVSLVDVSDPASPFVQATAILDDPTPALVRRGRQAFHDANASSNGTFACESCHPDGNTDQLLWVLGGPQCDAPGCDQIPLRSTMPIRGLRDTLPFHWDGVPADPFGGTNGEVEGGPNGPAAPNCTDELSCFRHLIDGGLAGTMCDQETCGRNDADRPGELDEAERDAMAAFMMHVPYPPARERPRDDDLSPLARQGFSDFFVNQGRGACGNPTNGCHPMPLWNGTNSTSAGMDAPTFRGLPDRWLTLPQGRTFFYELLALSAPVNEVPWSFDEGPDELSMWALTFGTEEAPAFNRIEHGIGPMPAWQMFLEGGTGFSGAFARQVTLSQETTRGDRLWATQSSMWHLEKAATDGTVLLQGEGVRIDDARRTPVAVTFSRGRYHERLAGSTRGGRRLSPRRLLADASTGRLLVTLTGRLGSRVGGAHAQPLVWSEPEATNPDVHRFPRLPRDNPMQVFGRHIEDGAFVLVDGRRVRARVRCAVGGRLPDCTDERVEIRVKPLRGAGMRLLQVGNPGGLTSNEFIVFVDG